MLIPKPTPSLFPAAQSTINAGADHHTCQPIKKTSLRKGTSLDLPWISLASWVTVSLSASPESLPQSALIHSVNISSDNVSASLDNQASKKTPSLLYSVQFFTKALPYIVNRVLFRTQSQEY